MFSSSSLACVLPWLTSSVSRAMRWSTSAIWSVEGFEFRAAGEQSHRGGERAAAEGAVGFEHFAGGRDEPPAARAVAVQVAGVGERIDDDRAAEQVMGDRGVGRLEANQVNGEADPLRVLVPVVEVCMGVPPMSPQSKVSSTGRSHAAGAASVARARYRSDEKTWAGRPCYGRQPIGANDVDAAFEILECFVARRRRRRSRR